MCQKRAFALASSVSWTSGSAAAFVLLLLTGCGGGSGSQSAPASYTIGGTVSGLTAPSAVVLANGNDTVTVTAQSSVPTAFMFPTPVLSGSPYSISVKTQPTGALCSANNGTGTIGNTNVSNVTVTCVYTVGGTIDNLSSNGLVLANGSDTVTPAAGATSFTFSQPVAIDGAYSVSIQSQPTGEICGVAGSKGSAPQTLSLFVPCAQTNANSGSWILEGTLKGAPVYGTRGVAAPANTPGARAGALTWVDTSNKFWLFGGYSLWTSVSNGLSDLWKYDPATGQWTWVAGPTTVNASAIYGAQGTPAAANVPGVRDEGVSWIDVAGNLWLFGGFGFDPSGANGALNDLWKYDPGIGQWTWMSGSTTINSKGVYGTKGIAASTNVPPGLAGAVAWIDGSGNLWLFGGNGDIWHNDLWEYGPNTGQWTWMGGAADTDILDGVYGTQGVAAPGNVPGARVQATAWTDTSGNFWLFGGTAFFGQQNDLWKYSPGTGLWTWVAGSTQLDMVGIYGSQGVPAPGNLPGTHTAAVSWVDHSGNLWLFGGFGQDSGPSQNIKAGGPVAYKSLNDIWEYNLMSGQWTWVNGFAKGATSAVYGSAGVGSAGMPGGSSAPMLWVDEAGNAWVLTNLDLWKFTPPK
jgi:N-acetylneuraminic acid mutarotase